MQVTDRKAARGKRVRLNEQGVRWAKAGNAQQNYREWRGREGVLAHITVNRIFGRVRWDGCRAAGDTMPLSLLEEVT